MIARDAIYARLGYVRTKFRASKEQWALVREAEALLNFLRQSGCTFHQCSALIRNPVPKGVAFRYDIHLRDVPGARFFAASSDAERAGDVFSVLGLLTARTQTFTGLSRA